MPFLARDGCQLYYETHGEGPALVFAHGLGGSHLAWWQQVPHFRDRYTCVTFDHRGFGLSRDAPGGPGPDAFVDDLAALVEHLGVRDVRLVADRSPQAGAAPGARLYSSRAAAPTVRSRGRGPSRRTH